MVALLIFITLLLLAGKNCWTQKVHLIITFSKFRLEHPAEWAVLMPNGLKWRQPLPNGTVWKIGRILWKHLVDFLKTYLTKFAVIWVKRRQKAGFLSPRSTKIIATKEKERSKSQEKERGRREKSNGCTLSFYNSYFGENVGRKRSIWRYLLINLMSFYFYVSLSFFSSSVTRSEFWIIPWHSSSRCSDTVFRSISQSP